MLQPFSVAEQKQKETDLLDLEQNTPDKGFEKEFKNHKSGFQTLSLIWIKQKIRILDRF